MILSSFFRIQLEKWIKMQLGKVSVINWQIVMVTFFLPLLIMEEVNSFLINVHEKNCYCTLVRYFERKSTEG